MKNRRKISWTTTNFWNFLIVLCGSSVVIAQITPYSANPFATSSLKEHGDHELCTDPLEFSVGHRLEKRSYLPPVTCTRTHELNAVRSKVHCSPRLRLIRLPWPNDTSIHKMTPSHVEVNRCAGGCNHRQQSCLPTRVRKKKIPVLLAQCSIHSEKCDKTCAEVEIDEHIECGCECKIKRHHCNAKQVCAMSYLVQLSLDIVKMVVRPFLFTKLSSFIKSILDKE